MKKLLLVLTLLLVVLVACGGTPLASTFDEGVVREISVQVIEDVMAQDYESVWERFDPAMVAALPTVSAFEDAIGEFIVNAGENRDVTVMAINGETVDGQDIARVVVRARNEDGNLQFTIAFNTDMELISFMM